MRERDHRRVYQSPSLREMKERGLDERGVKGRRVKGRGREEASEGEGEGRGQ